jgi:(p)ppGpp synthase/HD superfamily hydrolase
MTVVTESYSSAVAYAAHVHAAQLRTGTNTPYISHLLGVSSLVLEAGGDEDLAIAALLHDAAEDHGGEERLADIAERFGDRVALVVRECSDSLLTEGQEKPDWETRKHAHLARLESASDDTLVVWAADKVHNARSLVTDVQINGPGELTKFHAPADRILWYYRENLRLVERGQVPELLRVPLRIAVAQLADFVGG